MKKIQTILCAAALASMSLFASCEKENTQSNLPKNSILVAVQDYSSDSKAYISGTYTNWENGDKVVLGIHNSEGDNSYEATIGITSPSGVPITAATVENGEEFMPATGDDVYGAYPVELFKDGNTLKTLGESVNVTLPATYTYTATGEHQLLTSPMVAYTVKTSRTDDTNDTLNFKNVCAMLKITLNAPASGSFTLDAIEISADGTQLSGAASVNCQDASMSWTSSNTSNNTVTLNFGANAVAINATKSFYVPIPPVSSGTRLHIRLHNQISDTWMTQIDETHPLTVTLNQALGAHTIANVKPITVTGDITYTFYDYITNLDGASRKSLNISPTNDCKLQIVYSVPRISGIAHRICGSSHTSGNSTVFSFAVTGGSGTDNWGVTFAGKTASLVNTRLNGSNIKNQIVTEVLHNSDGYYARVEYRRPDDPSYSVYTATTTPVANGVSGLSDKIYVFGTANEYEPEGMKLYSFTLERGGNVEYNFVPATNSVGEIGVYNQADPNPETAFIKFDAAHFAVGNDSK